jgi:hypothetical protein
MIHFAKTNPFFLTSEFIYFFFLNHLITNYKIFPICNSLLICKCVEEMDYQNDKQEHSIYIPTSIRSCNSLHMVVTSLINGHDIVRYERVQGE